MDRRVTVLTGQPDPTPPTPRSSPKWTGVLLVAAGIAFGYLLAQGTTSSLPPVDTASPEAVPSVSATAPPGVASALPAEKTTGFSGTVLASVESARGLMTWPGDGGPIKIRLTSDVWAAAYDAAQGRIAVTVREYGRDGLALYVGDLGDVRFVTSGVTGFAWHPTEPSAIAWVEESKDGFALVKAVVSDGVVMANQIAVLRDRVRLIHPAGPCLHHHTRGVAASS